MDLVNLLLYLWAPLVAQTVKHLSAMLETGLWSLGQEDPLQKEMATHSSTLAWKIPWTEERGRLQSMGSQTVRHDWATLLTWTIKYLTLIFMLLFAILWFNSNHKGMRICKLFWGRLAHLIIHGKGTLQNLKDNLELNFFCTNQYQK